MTNTVLCPRAGGGGEEGKGILSLGAAGARHHKRKPCLSATLRDRSPRVRHLQQLKDGSVGEWFCTRDWGFLPATQRQEEWRSSRGIQGVYSLMTWGEEFSDALKGFLQEAGSSVVLAFGVYCYTHQNPYILRCWWGIVVFQDVDDDVASWAK